MDQTLTTKSHLKIPTWLPFGSYLVFFLIAEIVTNTQNIAFGLSIHATLLITLLTHGVLSDTKNSKLYTAMAVIPLIRLMSLSMPFWLTEQENLLALVNIPLIVSTIVAIYTLGYTLKDFKFTFNMPVFQTLTIITGFFIGTFERMIIQPEPLANSLAFTDVFWPALSLMLFTGFSEELLFRGILQKTATEALGVWPGIIYISILFGLMHIGWNSAFDVVFVTIVGFFWGWIVHVCKSLLGVTIAHGIANIMLFIILPLSII